MKGATLKKPQGKSGRSEAARAGDAAKVREKNRPQSPGFSLSMWFTKHQETAVDSLSRLFGNIIASTLTWAVIGIALALPVSLLLLVSNLHQLGAGIDQTTQVSLYLNVGTDQEAVNATLARLESRDDVSTVQYISAEQGLEVFAQATDFDDVLAGLEENPLPAVIQVTPSGVEENVVSGLLADLENLPGVDQAVLDMDWVRKLNVFLELAQKLTLGLAVLLCLGVLLVIGNTIRLAIENRRAEIVVIKLIGGTNAYVSRPFLYTGLWYGVGGGLFASLVITVGLLFLQGPVSRLAALYGTEWSISGWNVSGFLLLLIAGGLLGWAGAWGAVLRHLRAIEPG